LPKKNKVRDIIYIYIIAAIIFLAITAFVFITKLIKTEIRDRKERINSDKAWSDMERGLNAAFDELEYYKKMIDDEQRKADSDKKTN
jgi:predicted Holliday junction resolvase-like endonuclease